MQKVSANPYFIDTSFPPVFYQHQNHSSIMSLSVWCSARPPSPIRDARLARSGRPVWRWLDTTPAEGRSEHDRPQIGTKPA